ncbi:rCG22896 [Rattus norvegicus]|uniref:RCG22896 n=1 Tax=Rattus norvegicus TaxID=10116 RepID=A6KP73_RAT|nr:rCG22896 [Rattus norvegicus]
MQQGQTVTVQSQSATRISCHFPLAHILSPSKELGAERQQKSISFLPSMPHGQPAQFQSRMSSSQGQRCCVHWFSFVDFVR